MQVRRYRSLILKMGCKTFEVERFRLAHAGARAARKGPPGHEQIRMTNAVHAFDVNGERIAYIERDTDGMGVTVTTAREPKVSYEIPLANIGTGVPELPEKVPAKTVDGLVSKPAKGAA